MKLGGPAPGFFVETLEGEKIGHADWDRPPHPVLLIFISPNCNACRRMVPDLESIAEKHKNALLDIILLGINGSKEEFISWRQKLNVTLPIAIDSSDTVRHNYSVYSLPTIFYISAGGLVRHKHTGYKQDDDKLLEKMFKDRLKRLEEYQNSNKNSVPGTR